ncbi:MAG: PleD family two-component system response regulator [Thiolinea sp.]
MSIKNVLLVTISPTDRYELGQILRNNGFTVSTADTGETALELAKVQQPDIIVMDTILPSKTGIQTTRILTRDPATQHIPVILCAADNRESDRTLGIRQGARNYLIKPIQDNVLLTAIAELDESE